MEVIRCLAEANRKGGNAMRNQIIVVLVGLFVGGFMVEESEASKASDIDLLVRYSFAEAANQNSTVWAAGVYVALNRLKSGQYGKTLNEVVNGMSSAIRNNSDQWKKANKVSSMNAYEKKVYNQIVQTVTDVMNGKVKNPIGKATHFENVKAFGKPDWAKNMVEVATIGAHTYFKKG